MTAKKPQQRTAVKKETVAAEEVVESDVKEEQDVTPEVSVTDEAPEISVTEEDSAAGESEEVESEESTETETDSEDTPSDSDDADEQDDSDEEQIAHARHNKRDKSIIELNRCPWYDSYGYAKNGIEPHNKFEELLTGPFEIFSTKHDGSVQIVAGHTLVWIAAADIRKFI